MPTVIHNFDDIDFDLPGKHHYQVAFHLDDPGATRSFR